MSTLELDTAVATVRERLRAAGVADEALSDTEIAAMLVSAEDDNPAREEALALLDELAEARAQLVMSRTELARPDKPLQRARPAAVAKRRAAGKRARQARKRNRR